MYVDSSTVLQNGKAYTRHLLRTSYREGGKVKKKTIANISSCTEDEIKAIKLALKSKKNLKALGGIDEIEATLGKRIGAVWLAHKVAERTGIAKALGKSPEAQKAMLQIITRLVEQGSRLSAVRFAQRHAICEILGIKKLNEDDLYENLRWVAYEQPRIEHALFEKRYAGTKPTLFLYDVTSSYLEGDCNALANWGYNRDRKKGKKQIVAGLLAGPDGFPVAVRVFEGNTNDTKTVSEQIKILAQNFGVKDVTLVGDRGMLKGPQIEALPDDFRYITALTKPQIQKMVSKGLFQYELFDENISEVASDGVRYVLRRNPVRAQEMAQTRALKQASIMAFAEKQTTYLAEHSRANACKALARVEAKIKKFKAEKWLSVSENERILTLSCDDDALVEVGLLDGCYVIKSDVPKADADAQTLHDRYCDLEMVERTFRTMKTTHLELRPVFVRKAENTKAHAFIVMLALLLQRELEQYWRDLDITVEEGLHELSALSMQEIKIQNTTILNIPKPTSLGAQLLQKAQVNLPSVLPRWVANVSTTKKLPLERI